MDQILPWLIPIILLAIIIPILIYIATRKETVVEQAFLIYVDGALLAHATNHKLPEDMDTDIFSSMLTAIQDFVKDSFKDEGGAALNRLEFGEKKIAMARSNTAKFHIALVYTGDDKKVDEISEEIIKDIDEKYGEELVDWDGNLNIMEGSREILQNHLS